VKLTTFIICAAVWVAAAASDETVCLVVVSTEKRPQIVYDTIESFERYNTYPLHQRVLVSDSYHNVTYLHRLRHNRRWTVVLSYVAGEGRYKRYLGFIDHVYHRVLKPDCVWVFFMEDDFRWVKSGFIELTMKVTREHYDDMTMFVPMSLKWSKKYDRKKGIHSTNNVSWVWSRRRRGIWGGFTFHPHLMHLKTRYYGDLKGSFARWRSEAALSRYFMGRNMYTAAAHNTTYAHHVGRSTWGKG